MATAGKAKADKKTGFKKKGGAKTLLFSGRRSVNLHPVTLPQLHPGSVRIKAAFSAISAGTEMLFYRGEIEKGAAADLSIPGLTDPVSFPMSYGYSVAGRVEDIGPHVAPLWKGKRVFAFHPHQDRFNIPVKQLLEIPAGVTFQSAAMFPNLETAVNLVQDARPLIGERVLVLGLGPIGLTTAMMLNRFPLESLTLWDPMIARRRKAETLLTRSAGTRKNSVMVAGRVEKIKSGFNPNRAGMKLGKRNGMQINRPST